MLIIADVYYYEILHWLNLDDLYKYRYLSRMHLEIFQQKWQQHRSIKFAAKYDDPSLLLSSDIALATLVCFVDHQATRCLQWYTGCSEKITLYPMLGIGHPVYRMLVDEDWITLKYLLGLPKIREYVILDLRDRILGCSSKSQQLREILSTTMYLEPNDVADKIMNQLTTL